MCGAPGIGQASTAPIITRELGYEPVEVSWKCYWKCYWGRTVVNWSN